MTRRLLVALSFACLVAGASAEAQAASASFHEATFVHAHASHAAPATHHSPPPLLHLAAALASVWALVFLGSAATMRSVVGAKKRYRKYPTGLSPPAAPII